MHIVLILLVTIVLIVDFAKLNKQDKKSIYLYIVIVVMILVVVLADKYEFFEISPLEIGIKKMRPVTNWIDTKLN